MESTSVSSFDWTQFNPANPILRANPYPFYHLLRQAMPVCPTPAGAWLISGYAQGESILVDKRFATIDLNRIGQVAQLPQTPALEAARAMMATTMLFMDPPRHGRIRGLVSRAFSPRMIESLRPRIGEIATTLLERFEARAEVDLIKDFAYPLPVIVIAEMLGVPAEDRDLFRRWTTDLAPLIDFLQSSEAVDRAMLAMEEIGQYLRELVQKRRTDPREDLVSALIAAEERGDHLTEDEMLANIVLLLGAGHETTANLIGNGLLALINNRGELEELRGNRELIRSAVEESLRYDSPVQVTARRTLEEVRVGEITIPTDSHVIVLIGACNRDPARFADPDNFSITREKNDHLTFGGGTHYCLGANLARAEGQVAIDAIVQRFPRVELAASGIEYRELFNLRGLKSLPVTLS